MLSSPPSGEVSSSLRLVGGDRGAPARDLQAEQQGPGGGVGGERDLVAGDLDRHAGGDQRSGQSGNRGPARAHQHGHLVPADAVAQVGAAQDLGDVLGLGARAAAGVDLDLALRQGRVGARLPEAVAKTSGGRARGMLSRSATLRVAASRSRPNRRVVSRARIGAGAPSAVRNRSGKSRMPRASAPRNA